MSTRPSISGKELSGALQKAGFLVVRQKGSHQTLKNPVTGRRVTVPVGKKKDLPKGTIAAIIAASGLTEDQFYNLL